MDPGPTPARDLKLQHNISTEPCGAAGGPFGPLHFANGLDIDAAMKPELDRLVAVAQTCPGVRIEIHGYTDGTGSAFTNRSMAQARAQAVFDYLITAGVAPNRLATIGRGSLDLGAALQQGHQPRLQPPRRVRHQGSRAWTPPPAA